MILSNLEIQKAIDDGDLVIDPEPLPRRPTLAAGSQCPYNTTSVDLRLGPNLSIVPSGGPRKPVVLDLRQGGIAPYLSQIYTPRILDAGGYALQPGHFVLGMTLESISLPIRQDRPSLAARIEGRSSYARCGLLVHFTAPTIHADFTGPIALEIKNLGEYPIMLYSGDYIAQLIVERVSGTPFKNPSQFQGQALPTGLKS